MGNDIATRVLTMTGQGSPVLIALALLSVLALAIVILKLYHFARVGLWSTRWIDEVLDAVGRGDVESALARAEASPNPVARVLEIAIAGRVDPGLSEEHLREEVQRAGNGELAALESRLRGLETVGVLAPLLGLLGTVLGMINAFMRLEEGGSRVDPSLLSGGIWEALLTTAVGLAIAIPAMAALTWLESQIDRLRRSLADSVTRVLTSPGLAACRNEAAPAPSGLAEAHGDTGRGTAARSFETARSDAKEGAAAGGRGAL
jgi:biopolymer transport protein ExbB